MKQDLIKRAEHNHAYHTPSNDAVKIRHEQVREYTKHLAEDLIDICPESRELSIALTKLEEVMMWANVAIARNQ